MNNKIFDAINAVSRLPGVGPKTAARLVYAMLEDSNLVDDVINSLTGLKENTKLCPSCWDYISKGQEKCGICKNRTRETICVVESPLGLQAIERTGGYVGQYHVLHGVLSPIDGIGLDDLKINELIDRVRSGSLVNEVIIATSPSMEGDATADYLMEKLADYVPVISRIGRGLPIGADLEYADVSTLLSSMTYRKTLQDCG